MMYPPPPWNLRGQLYGSLWSVPVKDFQAELPSVFKPLVNFGRVGVYAGFVDYQAGSSLVYHELLGGLVVRLKGTLRYALHVTHMWVDSEASRQGGRERWGVPKEMARFDYNFGENSQNFKGEAYTAEAEILAQGDFKKIVSLPRRVRLPTPFPNLQILDGKACSASGTFWSVLELCKGGMLIPAHSQLATLGIAGRKPLVSFGGLNFRMKLQAARII